MATVVNESNIYDAFESVCSTITLNILTFLGKGKGWIIHSVLDHTINTSKYNLLAGSSYQITKRTRPSKKGLINIQNFDDNECFNWCLFRYLHPAYHNPIFSKLKKKKKKKKKNSIAISVFGYENKEK